MSKMKLLCVGAHPDDLEFGCGGTLLRLLGRGTEAVLYVTTAGDYGAAPFLRKKEQASCARLLGAKLVWGDFKDTEVFVCRRLIEAVEAQIRLFKPDMVLTHFHDDTHQDHRAVSRAVTTAARHVKNVLFFEGPSTMNFTPTVFTDIGPVMEEKLELLKCHRSQVDKTNVPNLSILEIAKSTAVFRGYGYRVKYAEGFVPQRFSLHPELM